MKRGMVVVGCSGAKHISRRIAKKIKSEFCELQVKKFPDGELNVRFMKNIKGKNVLLIQSFYGNVNEKIVETLFAGYTAKDLGARKVKLLAVYFPYFRKDKRFKSGDCISIEAMGDMFKFFDKVFVVEPHLHRIKSVGKVMSNGKRVGVIEIIADYIKRVKIKEPVFIGPDVESLQWAKHIANRLGKKAFIFRKTRHSSRRVKIKVHNKIDVKGKNVIIIDDIISTGHTMLESIKKIKKFRPRKIYCIAIHGVFAENALKRLRKHAIVLSTNTIPTSASRIDVSEIAKELR